MWTYSQTTGELRDVDGRLLVLGYSGHGEGRNNPDMQAVHDVGPIPLGEYSILTPRDQTGGRHGPYVLPLSPGPHTLTFGRTGFLLHGDSCTHDASLGCICASPLAVRKRVWESGDHVLIVKR